MEQTTAVIATRGLRPQASYHNESSRAKRPVRHNQLEMVTAEDFSEPGEQRQRRREQSMPVLA
jgi:hypothetical protein